MAFSAVPDNKENIVLQLKWYHQFQFAGYYVSIEKGYYDSAGLNVVVKEGRPDLNVTDEIVAGRADYGIATPYILVERQKGKPVVALASIFQHSPVALFVLKKSGITNPQELVNKKVALRPGDVEMHAMFLSEGIDPAQIDIVPLSPDINDLVNGKVDAMAGYITDRPFVLQKRNVEYLSIRPVTYGIDFYGDCLFTTEKEIHDHPRRVAKFLAASIKGWEYALKHPEETADLILKKYGTRLSREELLFEAEAMHELIQPEFIEIGYMNPGRWRHIANIMVQLGILQSDVSLEGFLYSQGNSTDYARLIRIFQVVLLVLAFITLAGIILFLFNRKLRQEVALRTRGLERERQFNDAILRTLPGVVYVYEDGKRLIRWNKNFQDRVEMTDEQMAGCHPLDWVDGRDKQKVIRALNQIQEKGEVALEATVTVKRGKIPYYFNATMLKIEDKTYLIGVGIDLTSRHQLEEQLRQAQKMESIGRLAGGVAHDFNNVLTAIIGYSELLLADRSLSDRQREQAALIHSAGERASALTRQLLAFSRRQILEKKVVSINTIITDFLKILKKILGEDIVIKTYLDARDGIIEADIGQVEQILMNLAVNAKDAMPQGGDIVIETGDVVIDKSYADSHMDIEPGHYIMLAVTDHGEGMDSEVQENVFDPFFTTKEKGKGTGLGLATVYGIVKQHEGHIHVYSEKDIGTTFKIYFPASAKKVTSEDDDHKSVPLSPGHGTIMVVDDEDYIRKFVIDTLEPLGYTCMEASCGADALEIIKNYHGDIHLLLTDVVMPGMSGRELFENVCHDRPEMKVLFMSGYTENVITSHGMLDEDINYIPKPISPLILTRKIRIVMES